MAQFSYVLSRGVYVKQHVPGAANAYQVFLRLQPEGLLGGLSVSWQGGVESAVTGTRGCSLGDVKLVSVGLGTAGFASCESAAFATPAACLSLVFAPSLLFDEPRSIDLELSSAEECEAIAFGFSLAVADGYEAVYKGPEAAWSSILSCF